MSRLEKILETRIDIASLNDNIESHVKFEVNGRETRSTIIKVEGGCKMETESK